MADLITPTNQKILLLLQFKYGDNAVELKSNEVEDFCDGVAKHIVPSYGNNYHMIVPVLITNHHLSNGKLMSYKSCMID
jgi:hypothetical protein